MKKIIILLSMIATLIISNTLIAQDTDVNIEEDITVNEEVTGDVFVIKKLEFQQIDRWYANYIKKGLKEANENGASLIILEIDTPGGLVSEALAIKNALLDSNVPVVTFINKNALSAGALISLSTKAIYMADGSVIGAATPVYLQGGSATKASEKEVSAMRAAMRSSAEASGKNTKVAEAMVDEKIVLTKKDNGIDLNNKTLLTLSTDEAVELKIADAKANSIQEIIKLRGLDENITITTVELSEYDEVAKFMLNPLVLMIFLALGIIGIYIEVKTPGFGVGGAIAIIGFSLFFFAQVSVGGASWIAPMIFIVGSILVLIELFVIPGFGVAGIAGIVAIFASVFISFGVSNLRQGTYVVFFALILAVTAMIIMAKFLPRSTLFKKISLETDTHGYGASKSYDYLLGLSGVAFTFFRPSGILTIDNKKYDAISQGEFIKKDSKIKVISVEGNKIVVSEEE